MRYHRAAEEDEREESLPDMRINNLDLTWPIWLKWRATGRRFLPSQLMEEDRALLDDILAMDAAYSMVEEEMKNG